MEKIKEYKGIIVLVLVVLAGAFYWYEWRPMQIRKNCGEWASRWVDMGGQPGINDLSYLEKMKVWGVEYDQSYKKCLNSEGLEK